MNLEINMEIADDITRCSLLDTYISLKDDLKNNASLHEYDRSRYKKTVKAIEAVGDWYFFDFKSSVKEERERRKNK